ncbi:MAG: hypothetical protein J0M04_09920 [Verrucomicrobia bacterium]|nr:hypothetical protein [Verrucomicrobiota bacterium]
MTPPFEFSEPRRSFVKKTLATSVSISFAGLIRAHGEEGGGTTVQETAGTTYTSTVEETAGTTAQTTTPETCGTTVTTTSVSTACGKKYLEKIEIVFDRIIPLGDAETKKGKWQLPNGEPLPGIRPTENQPDASNDATWVAEDPEEHVPTSGHMCGGSMKVTLRNCKTNVRFSKVFPVYTGGFRSEDTLLESIIGSNDTTLMPGDEMGVPAGTHEVGVQTNDGILPNGDGSRVDGVPVSNNNGVPAGSISNGGSLGNRSDIKIHQPGITEGCIVVGDAPRKIGDKMSDLYKYFNAFERFIEQGTAKAPCQGVTDCPLLAKPKLLVWYDIPGHPELKGSKGRTLVPTPSSPPYPPVMIPSGPVPGENPDTQRPSDDDMKVTPVTPEESLPWPLNPS